MNEEPLVLLFEQWSKEKVLKITPLAKSGSDRSYYRFVSENKAALGVYNPDPRENLAFIEFSKVFIKNGVRVPKIYAEDTSNHIYLIEDLGDTTLFAFLSKEKEKTAFTPKLRNMYQRVIEQLPIIQTQASKGLDFSLCYPRSKFDKQSMLWDLNYFKYYFLKLAGLNFDEQALEDDFRRLISFLLEADSEYFLYRDFQSRNIMIHDDDIYFIDYQGGRKGALQYDLASLLYDAKAAIPQKDRNELLDYYIFQLKKHQDVDEKSFRAYFDGFVIIRILQAMGAYGFRGFYEKKAHFLASIPYAQENLLYVLNNNNIPLKLDTLWPLLKEIGASEKLRNIAKPKVKLKIQINSFSYKRGIPLDESGNGGGYAFDCRALPNPGRYDEYKSLTGRDLSVIEFLEKEESVHFFFDHVKQIVGQSVETYLKRNFESLCVNFGCTGGQHRSVFLAEKLSVYLKEHYNVSVVLRHREQEMK